MAIQPQPSFIKLEPGTPVRLRVTAARLEDRLIRDPRSLQEKTLSVLVLEISEVNGVPRQTSLSFTSLLAQQDLTPLINSGELFRRTLEVIYRPKGFMTAYEFRLF